MHPPRLLLAQHPHDACQHLARHLATLPCRVQAAHDAGRALHLATHGGPWDLLVLAADLPAGSAPPGLDGLGLCQALRRHQPDRPLLVLPGRAAPGADERVRALDLGADDCLPDPLDLAELSARVRALLRRAARRHEAADAAAAALQVGALRLLPQQRRAWLAGAELRLAPREFALLCRLASQPGLPVHRQALLTAVWGPDHAGYDHTVDAHIHRLRGKLAGAARPAAAGTGPAVRIHTVWGAGWRLEAG